MAEVRTKVGAGGRIVLPAAFREALGLKTGDDVLIVLDEDGVRVLTPRQAVARAQALVRRYVPSGKSMAGELIAERRKQAKRE
jgi:AbrB family looped-hinge helix DNA binding protein